MQVAVFWVENAGIFHNKFIQENLLLIKKRTHKRLRVILGGINKRNNNKTVNRRHVCMHHMINKAQQDG